MRLFDVTADDMGDVSARVEAPTAEAAAREYTRRTFLSSGTRVTVRELSGSRERRVFRVVVT